MNVYINLPVEDVARTREFFAALGFSFNERFCSDDALAVKLNDNAGLMLLAREKFRQFTPHEIADTKNSSQTLIALQLDSRAAVKEIVAKALENGGTTVQPENDMGFMYLHAFADPDGNIFEPFFMDEAAMAHAEAAQ